MECLGQHTSYPGRKVEKELSSHCSVYWSNRLFLPNNTDELNKSVLYCLFTSFMSSKRFVSNYAFVNANIELKN